MENYKPKISKRNHKFLKELNDCFEKYSVVGVVDITSLPAQQFQGIRSLLSKRAKVLIMKKNLIQISIKGFENKFKNITKLLENLDGIVGLVFTNENPFKIFKFINKNKSQAKAKAGQIAPNDIIVPAGPTSFSPGPIIGELGALKIKAGINAGKVEIKEDCIVAKEGEEISEKLSGVLSRLDIKPMEIGLNIKVLYEDECLYSKSVLNVDEKEILDSIKNGARDSNLLAIGLNYVTSENVNYFISKGYRESLAIAFDINYVSKDTIKKLIQKASCQNSVLESRVN